VQAREQGLDSEACAQAASRALVAAALDAGSYDDITVLVSLFNWQGHTV
jgi:hypothetical protein